MPRAWIWEGARTPAALPRGLWAQAFPSWRVPVCPFLTKQCSRYNGMKAESVWALKEQGQAAPKITKQYEISLRLIRSPDALAGDNLKLLNLLVIRNCIWRKTERVEGIKKGDICQFYVKMF